MAVTTAFAGPVNSLVVVKPIKPFSTSWTDTAVQVQQDQQSLQGAQSVQGKQDSQFGLPGGFGFPDTIVVNQAPTGGYPGQFDPRVGGPCNLPLGCGQFGPQPFNRFGPQFGYSFM
ncbi:hypothetical protein AC578_8429 [Pseudocercospora eumusae]|uniref:Uncharacterized protein n=1 Tax=Pseudocercospora eumusae TaxID=321146 RepID=A0A139HS19_9PEZI|nr:hypothetical protein AC578_8429 [Pseudocercospora eumusae]